MFHLRRRPAARVAGTLGVAPVARAVGAPHGVQAAQRERDELRLSDTVVIHDLSHETVSELTRQLMSLAGLRRVYLVRKLTRHCENVPLYVLGFRTRAAWSLSNSARSSATLEQIRRDVKFPGETLVVSLDNSNSQFESKLRRLKGSRLI